MRKFCGRLVLALGSTLLLILCCALVFGWACGLDAHAQAVTQESVSGNLSSVGTVGSDLLQVRFSLVNCGSANPVVAGVTSVVTKVATFTAGADGNFTGSLWGNDQITCNLGMSTEYSVTYLRNGIPTGVATVYRVTGSSWSLSTATPVTTLPPVSVLASGFTCATGEVQIGIEADWTPICAATSAAITGPQYTIPAFNGAGSGSSYGVGASNMYTDATGDNLVVPGTVIAKTALTVGTGATLATIDVQGNTIVNTLTCTSSPCGLSLVTAPIVTGDSVGSVTITDSGNYPGSCPTDITFTGGGGTGAAGYVSHCSSEGTPGFDHVTGVTMTNNGTGYTSAPTVTFGAAGVGGTIATGVAVLVPSSSVTWVQPLITSASDGTQNFSLATPSLPQARVLASPISGVGQMTPRTLVASDISDLSTALAALNAGTATALAATPTLCTVTGQVPTGVDIHGNAVGCFAPGGGSGAQIGSIWNADYSNDVNTIIGNSAFSTAAVATILLGPNYTGAVSPVDAMFAQATVNARTIWNLSEGAFNFSSINPGPMQDSWNAGFLFNCAVSQTPAAQAGGFAATGHSQCLNANYNIDIPGYYHGAIFPALPNGGFQAELLHMSANFYSASMNKSFIQGTVNANGAGDDNILDFQFVNNYGGQDHSADEGWHTLRLVNTIGGQEFTATVGSATPNHSSGYTQLAFSATDGNPNLGVMRILLDDTQAIADTVTAVGAGDGSGDVALTMTAATYPVSTRVTLTSAIEPPVSNYYTKTLEPVTVNTTADLSVSNPVTSTGPAVGFISNSSAECATVQSYGAFDSGSNTQVVNLMLSDHHNVGDVVYIGGMACHGLTIDADVVTDDGASSGVKSTFYVYGSTANNTLIAGRQIGAGIDGAFLRPAAVHVYPSARVLDVRPTAGNAGDDFFVKVEEGGAQWAASDAVESGLIATSQNDTFYFPLTDNSAYTRGSTYWYLLLGNQAGAGRDFYLYENKSATVPGWMFNWQGLIGGVFKFDSAFNLPFLQQFNCGYTLVNSTPSAIKQNCASGSVTSGWTLIGDTSINSSASSTTSMMSVGWLGGFLANVPGVFQNIYNGAADPSLYVKAPTISPVGTPSLQVDGITQLNGNTTIAGDLAMGSTNKITSNAYYFPNATNCVLGTDGAGLAKCNPNSITANNFIGTTTGGTVFDVHQGSSSIGGLSNDLGALEIFAASGVGGNSGQLELSASNLINVKSPMWIGSTSSAIADFFNVRIIAPGPAQFLIESTSATNYSSFQLAAPGAVTETRWQLYTSGNSVGAGAGDFVIKDYTNGKVPMSFQLGTTRTMMGGPLQLASYTVAALPSSPQANDTAIVTDATAFTPGSAPTGGGSTRAPVFYNGSAWLMY